MTKLARFLESIKTLNISISVWAYVLHIVELNT
jgi:hypothetical protein